MSTTISKPNFKSDRIAKHQDTKDIVRGIARAIAESKEDSKILATKFYDKDKIKSCEKVWHYLKKNLKYEQEESSDQTSKTIARLLDKTEKKGDCKHYTIFSYSILEALGIPVYMRLVSQKILNKEPTHIYTFAVIDGKKYVIDPVMNDFNQECKHNYKCDLTLNKNMAMTHLSGVHDVSIGKRKKGGFFSKAKDRLNAEEKKRKAKFLETKKKHDAFMKKKGKKITTGIKKRFVHIKKDRAVKSFLWAVSKNYLNLAKRIKDVYKTHPEDLKKFWANFGDWQSFTNAVNNGHKTGSSLGYATDGTCQCRDKKTWAKECCGRSMQGLPVLSGEESETSYTSGEAKQYEEGAKASKGIIEMIIQFFKDRKAKKNAEQDVKDAEALKNMEANLMNDPEIPKVDENGNPAPNGVDNLQTDSPDDKPAEDLPFLQTTTGKITMLGLGAGAVYMLVKK